MIQLAETPIDVTAVVDSVRSPASGAVVLFLGTVRERSNGRETSSLEYECYPEMAEKKLTELEAEARRRWPLTECTVVHRLGHLAVGEISIGVAVSAAHRHPAFEAGQWLIDRIKEVVPIWKKENYADGTSDWVHPGSAGTATESPVPSRRNPRANERQSLVSQRTSIPLHPLRVLLYRCAGARVGQPG